MSSHRSTPSSTARASWSSSDETADVQPRRLGLTSAAGLVVANTVGVGVFTTSDFALADLRRREYVLLAWVIGGLVALCGALSYGALAGFTAPIAAAALALEAYLGESFAPLVAPGWLATGAVLAAGLMHGLRLRQGVALQNVAVGLMLAVIAELLVVGALSAPLAADPDPPRAVQFDIGAFAMTLVWISFAYSGWNAAVYVAGEVRDPGRNLVRSPVDGDRARDPRLPGV